MKTKSFLLLGSLAAMVACSESDDNNVINPGTDFPEDAIVWKKDTTVVLTNHFLVEKNKSLYIEEGATIIASNTEVKPEIVVLGNLYCLGTEKNPITFTVEESSKTDRFSRNWGGIICGFESKEVYLDNVVLEYGGAQTTEESLSYQHQLFKTETGEGVPAVHFCNPNGKLVITNSTFFNNAEDQIYITGGQSIISNNKFISSGFDGGEAINYKSECLADICFNLVYDANTNALKLSNGGFVNVQADLNCYNNTIVNTGWRRPKVKGGSIWLEKNVLTKVFNNLMYDCRWAMKRSTEEPEDEASIIAPNYYYSSTETGVNQMAANDKEGIINCEGDIYSQNAGDKNPLFAAFQQQSNVDINVSGNTGNTPAEFNFGWDFSLSSNSPALSGAKTSLDTHFSKDGLVFEGLADVLSSNIIYSPKPAAFFGAYGKK